MTPVRSSASTRTNKPATSGSTPHETPFSTGHGDCRFNASTIAVVTTPLTKVGNPSCTLKAEQHNSTIGNRANAAQA